jgi:hypothetical protein
MRSTLLFITLLYFVHSATTSTQLDLENDQAFVELSLQPVSQAFFSAAALRIKEEGSHAGFSKIMALMNELIHDNRRQLQGIRKMNSRVQAECVIVTHKLKDRSIFFQGQTRYFKRRASVSLEEQTETVNIRNSRVAQSKSYNDLLTAATARHKRKTRKWTNRCDNGKKALDKVNIAIRAVTEWTPKSNQAFIQQSIKETADLYKIVKGMPLTVPEELIQLGANDKKLAKRLFQWLNYLKASIVDALAKCQRAKAGTIRIYRKFKSTVVLLRKSLAADAKHLGIANENYKILIKVYSQNEKIYNNLFSQNSLLVQANGKYCSNESNNFQAGQKAMEAQLKTIITLRIWLRKNFHRVKRWIKRRYAKVT